MAPPGEGVANRWLRIRANALHWSSRNPTVRPEVSKDNSATSELWQGASPRCACWIPRDDDRLALVPRDLRLDDNPALQAALAAGHRLVPVYIHAPDEEAPWMPGAANRMWLATSLRALASSLRERVKELGWREFSHHLPYQFPASTDTSLDRRFGSIRTWPGSHLTTRSNPSVDLAESRSAALAAYDSIKTVR